MEKKRYKLKRIQLASMSETELTKIASLLQCPFQNDIYKSEHCTDNEYNCLVCAKKYLSEDLTPKNNVKLNYKRVVGNSLLFSIEEFQSLDSGLDSEFSGYEFSVKNNLTGELILKELFQLKDSDKVELIMMIINKAAGVETTGFCYHCNQEYKDRFYCPECGRVLICL